MTGRQARRGRSGSGRGRSPGRLFNQGDLPLIVLRLVAEKPRHGYEIIKAIEAVSMGVYRPSAGTIYPILNHLEDVGYADVSVGKQGKKVYEITSEGRAYLDGNRELVRSIDGRLGGMRRFRDDEQTEQIRRAMDNLKAALRMRLSRESVEQEDIYRIVDAINAAATAVERA